MKSKQTLLALSLFAVMIAGCSKKTEEAASDASASTDSSMQQQIAVDSSANMEAAATADVAAPSPAYGTAENTENYQKLESNAVKSVAQQPVSTFSADVDTGSYTNVRRFLMGEQTLPPVDAVRVEEMINYFDYQYPQAIGAHPFAVSTETVDSPWKSNAKIIKIGIKAKDIDPKNLPAANLVFLVDVSGSMDEPNKLPLVKKR